MNKINPLKWQRLCTRCDPKQFTFAHTNELKNLEEVIGQERALSSLRFGLNIQQDGYNLYVLGSPGVGKYTITQHIVKQQAGHQSQALDWCYLFNFTNPQQPIAISVTAGWGHKLQHDMKSLLYELQNSIPAFFESREYQNKMKKIDEELKKKEEKMPSALQNRVNKIHKLHKEQQKKKHALQKELVFPVVVNLLQYLKTRYKRFPQVIAYLNAVQKDILKNLKDFAKFPEKESSLFLRYHVNLLINHREAKGAPVIYEDNPTYTNLLGRIEYMAQLGTLTTHFTLIYPGALHQANGGYLLLDALKVLSEPYAWEGLTRALRARQVTIEPLSPTPGFLNGISLQPQPIPLNLKVILLGEPYLYYLLCESEPNFCELFKVAADFDDYVPRTQKTIQMYARWIATLARQENLLPFDRSAICTIIDRTARWVSDVEKLSVHMRALTDLLKESDYWANQSQHKIVNHQDVNDAIKQQHYRANKLQKEIIETIQRRALLIDFKGSTIGQVNALTMIELGEFTFGFPLRITASVRLGRGEIINIEREVNLSGPLHSKGVFILASFIGTHYAKEQPLSLQASLVFEQNYNEVEGDSASLPELCALLSAIANLPIKQSLAITGSINQQGQVQPVGGVNEKIEGFFNVCQMRGLNGDQGVIIPASNVNNLMLNDEVVTAAKKNLFHIYPVKTVDDATSLLIGKPAGKRNKKGDFPRGSINDHITQYLQKLSKLAENEQK